MDWSGSSLGSFFALLSFWKTKKNNFENIKKLLEISWFYTCVSKSAIIWCTVPEIRSETDRIFCHFGPFFALLPHNPKIHLRYHHFTQVYQKSWSYAILFLRYGTWWIEFLFFILGYVLPFYSLNNWKKQN